MKYKIQQNSPLFGYIDLKYSTDGGKTYEYDLFDTYEDAQYGLLESLIELRDLESLEELVEADNPEEFKAYRIVEENVKADYDLNAENAKKGLKILEKIKRATEQDKSKSMYKNN